MQQLQARAAPAKKMLAELCKTAGEKIYRTDKDVEGILLLNVRPRRTTVNVGQFEMADPYGKDYQGEGYIRSFLLARINESGNLAPFRYVETEEGGKTYQYRLPTIPDGLSKFEHSVAESTWKMTKTEVSPSMSRYGVEFQDISTEEQRRLWIAGSALRIKDRSTGEVVAERIGYMADLYQGSNDIPRLPWFRAADVACPTFRSPEQGGVPGFVAQRGQTARFVFKVLTPGSTNERGGKE